MHTVNKHIEFYLALYIPVSEVYDSDFSPAVPLPLSCKMAGIVCQSAEAVFLNLGINMDRERETSRSIEHRRSTAESVTPLPARAHRSSVRFPARLRVIPTAAFRRRLFVE